MTPLIDTHAHFQSAGLKQGERATRELWAKAPELTGQQVVDNAQAAGVTKMLCVGCDLDDSRLAVEFVQGQPACWAAIGIHPHEASRTLQTDGALEQFAALVTEPKVVAVGECGLDYYYNHSSRQDQLRVLEFQMKLAHEHDLPLVFHVREALDDFWPLFDSFHGELRGVLHSFTDTAEQLQWALERNLYLGVNGIATFAKDPRQLAMYQAIPLDSLLLETDAPFLTPVPFRGKVNESKQIPVIAAYLATLRGVDVQDIAVKTTANAERLFDI